MTPDPVQRLGDFEIVREIGRGGMDIVYEARQTVEGKGDGLRRSLSSIYLKIIGVHMDCKKVAFATSPVEPDGWGVL